MFSCKPSNQKKRPSYQQFDMNSEVSEVNTQDNTNNKNIETDPAIPNQGNEQVRTIGSLRKNKNTETKDISDEYYNCIKSDIEEIEEENSIKKSENKKTSKSSLNKLSKEKDKKRKKESSKDKKKSKTKDEKVKKRVLKKIEKLQKDSKSKKRDGKMSLSERMMKLELNSDRSTDKENEFKNNESDNNEISNGETEISCVIDFYDKDYFNKVLAKKMSKFLAKSKRKRST